MKIWKKTVVIMIASIIYGGGVSLFLDPNNLAPGGVTGIAVIFNRLTGIETGTLYFIINIPIMLLGLWKFGGKFMASTAFAIFLTSVFTNLLAGYPPVTTDPLLAAIGGSVLVAISIGMIFKAGATTGGTDIIIKLLRAKYRHIKTGVLFFITDFFIVLASAFVFKDVNIAMYALISVVITGKVLDVVLYGGDEAALLYIISESTEHISERLMQEIDVGVTLLRGQGGYSKEKKNVIMCVTKKQQAPKVEEIVQEEDKEAFMIVTSAAEIYGEGYKSWFSEKI